MHLLCAPNVHLIKHEAPVTMCLHLVNERKRDSPLCFDCQCHNTFIFSVLSYLMVNAHHYGISDHLFMKQSCSSDILAVGDDED